MPIRLILQAQVAKTEFSMLRTWNPFYSRVTTALIMINIQILITSTKTYNEKGMLQMRCTKFIKDVDVVVIINIVNCCR
jgi:hypothetical protein